MIKSAEIAEQPSKDFLPNYRKVIGAIQKEKKAILNYAQIQFPGKEDTSLGFRPLNEDGSAVVITMTTLRKEELQQKPLFDKKPPEKPILVDSKSMLEIYPIVIEKPILIRKEAPVLLSMIPGDAHHLLKEVVLEGTTLGQLFGQTAKMGKEGSARKVFFIGKVIEGSRTYSQVVFDVCEDRLCCYTCEGDPPVYKRYTQKDGATSHELLSAEEYSFEIFRIANSTAPNKKALNTSTRGMQSEQMFKLAFEEEIFWNDKIPMPKDFGSLVRYLKKSNPTIKDAQEFFESMSPNFHPFALDAALSFLDVALAEMILEKGSVDINKPNYLGNSILYMALFTHNERLIEKILMRGANLNAKNNQGRSALHLAIYLKNAKMVDLLLTNRDSIDYGLQDALGQSALTLAWFTNNTEAFSKLLSTGKFDINHITKYGFTTLSYAAYIGDESKVDFLLQHKADPYVGRPNTLCRAIQARKLTMVKYLLDKGIDPTIVESKQSAPATNKPQNKLPIIFAATRGTPEIIRLLAATGKINNESLTLAFHEALVNRCYANALCLLECGADPTDKKENATLFHAFKGMHLGLIDAIMSRLKPEEMDLEILSKIFELISKTNDEQVILRFVRFAQGKLNDLKTNEPPLAIAIKHGKPNLFLQLLKAGANPMKFQPYSSSGFMELCKTGNLDFIKLCVEKFNIDFDQIENYEPTYAAAALMAGHLDVFKYLVDKGADVAKIPKGGNSALIHIVESGNIATLSYCLAATKVDLNLNVARQKTLLVHAYTTGQKEMVKYLLEQGADPTLSPKYCSSLLGEAIRKGDKEMVLHCLAKKPNLNALTKGETLLTEAAKAERWEIFEILIEHGANPAQFSDQFPSSSGFSKVLEKRDIPLLKKCLSVPGLELNRSVPHQETLIAQAYEAGFKEECQLLLEHGADPQLAPEYTDSALMMALKKKDEEFIELASKFGPLKNPSLYIEKAATSGLNRSLKMLLSMGGHALKVADLKFIEYNFEKWPTELCTLIIESLSPNVKEEFLKTKGQDKLSSMIFKRDSGGIIKLIDMGVDLEYKKYSFDPNPLEKLIDKDLFLEMLPGVLTAIRSRKGAGFLLPVSYLLIAAKKYNAAFDYLIQFGIDPKGFENIETIKELVMDQEKFKKVHRKFKDVDWNAVREKLEKEAPGSYCLEQFLKITAEGN